MKSLNSKSKDNIDKNDDNECIICYKEMNEGFIILDCKHTFHINCLKQYEEIHKKINCPLCRKKIDLSFIQHNKNNQNNQDNIEMNINVNINPLIEFNESVNSINSINSNNILINIEIDNEHIIENDRCVNMISKRCIILIILIVIIMMVIMSMCVLLYKSNKK